MARTLQRKKVVTVGGGTGHFAVLSGLKKYPLDLTAVVAMADDGGSTGVLRDELGVLPPGDIRQCLVALSTSPLFFRRLMNYRFVNGSLAGHSFGNLLLSALEKATGSFDVAVERASEILRLSGKVAPATLSRVRLAAYLRNGTVIRGQYAIENANLDTLRRIALEPKAAANPKAVRAILGADAVVIGPGNFYCSLIPNLLVVGIAQAIRKSRAKKIYVANLMTTAGQTAGMNVEDFAGAIERRLGARLDYVIYNSKMSSAALLARYAREGDCPTAVPRGLGKRFIGADLTSRKIARPKKGDPIARTLIRHDPDRLASLVVHKILKM